MYNSKKKHGSANKFSTSSGRVKKMYIINSLRDCAWEN